MVLKDNFVIVDFVLNLSINIFCIFQTKQCTGAANSFGRRYVNESAITHETSPSLIEDTNLDDVGDTAYCRHCCNTGQICNVQNHCGSPGKQYVEFDFI